MSVKQLPNGEWFYRFELKKQPYRKQGFRTRNEAESAKIKKQNEILCRPAANNDYNDRLMLCEAMEAFFEE